MKKKRGIVSWLLLTLMLLFGSDDIHDSDLYTSFMDAIASKGLEVQHPAVGDTFQLVWLSGTGSKYHSRNNWGRMEVDILNGCK